MKYLRKTFSVPVAGAHVTQADWDAIFPHRAKKFCPSTHGAAGWSLGTQHFKDYSICSICNEIIVKEDYAKSRQPAESGP